MMAISKKAGAKDRTGFWLFMLTVSWSLIGSD
jgi:hypothetical protein